MNLILNGAQAIAITSAEELASALATWGRGDGDFAILESGDADFVQSAIDEGGYIVEMRDGATATMFRAVRRTLQPDQRFDRWSRDEALGLIQDYFPLRGRSGQAYWEDMHMPTSATGHTVPRGIIWLAAICVGLGLFVYKIYRP